MADKAFLKRLKISKLREGMENLGLDPDEAENKEQAVEAIEEKFAADGAVMEYTCPNCGGDLPEVEECPYCGVDLSEEEEEGGEGEEGGEEEGEEEGGEEEGEEEGGEEEEEEGGEEEEEEEEEKPAKKKGKKKGGKKAGAKKEKGDAGAKLLDALLKEYDAPKEFLHYRKSRVSVWCENGVVASCYPGARSLRLHIPFLAEAYSEEAGEIVQDFNAPRKNMVARVTLEDEADIEAAVMVLKETAEMREAAAEEKATERKKKKKEKAAAKKEKEKVEKPAKGKKAKKGKANPPPKPSVPAKTSKKKKKGKK